MTVISNEITSSSLSSIPQRPDARISHLSAVAHFEHCVEGSAPYYSDKEATLPPLGTQLTKEEEYRVKLFEGITSAFDAVIDELVLRNNV